jgi:hypothetical protein
VGDLISRRDWLTVMGAAGTGALVTPGSSGAPVPAARSPRAPAPAPAPAPEPILPLTSTSEVFTPGRGRGFMKFSFDFPEPSVEFAGYRFGFLVFTRENAYGLDARRMTAERTATGLELDIRCAGLVWAGGQQAASGRVTALLRKRGDIIEWDVTAEMGQPVKAVTTVIRGVPRGRISTGGEPFDPRDDEILYGYPFGGGDLFGANTARGLTTPLVIVQRGEGDYVFVSSLDDRVRAKRFYFQPGERAYRLEAVFEAEGWKDQTTLRVPTWRLGRTASLDDAVQAHYGHLERAYRIEPWQTRRDLPDWARRTALVLAFHGMHYTGYVFNDYARMLEIARWVATRIPPERVLLFLAAWDGRYYWDYPLYRAFDRMGGEAGLKRLIQESQRLGFRVMPMFGANAANRRQPVFAGLAGAATHKIDGDRFDLNWVDWDNDRHQEGWLAYMNLGVPAWRQWLAGRIEDAIERYGVDAYFLDIAGGWVNNPQADMHEGMRQLVLDLRARFPHVMPCGEMHYDALLEFIPFYHVGLGRAARYARTFSHLSHPAPGRGSSGVHESGFGRFNPETLSLAPGTIPTLTVVDDTFADHQSMMEAVIERAKTTAP